MKAIVSEKGQVTIPKELRERMGINPGELLDFQEEQGKLIITKVNIKNSLDSVFGILNENKSTDELMILLRGESDTL